MLVELVVAGLGVIEGTELALGRGCSVLTGETGAGKTLLVAALDLLLGGKGDRALVRRGAAEARVEGRFALAPSHPAVALLEEHDLLAAAPSGAEVEVVVVRAVGRDGRSKARVNGRLVTLALLSELGGRLVEIAGQHEHGRLASPATQRHFLDAFAGPECVRVARETAAAVSAAARAASNAERLAAEDRATRRELDSLAHEIQEIEGAEVRAGESEALAAEATRLEHAEAIGAAISEGVEALRGERGAGDLLETAAAALGKLGDVDPGLRSASERLRATAYEIDDVALELAARATSADAGALEDARQRLALLQRLHRKYGDGDHELLAYLEKARARRAALESGADERSRAEAERDAAQQSARELAGRLAAMRAAAAPELARRVEETLEELALAGARVELRLEPRPLYEGGSEAVGFLVALNPGEALRPLAKVASGGELARVALALHLLTTARGPEVIVFDEVDAGVGGEAAQTVGRSLAKLAAEGDGQVLIVTHLPQVAAYADTHFRVTKSTSGGRAVARVTRVEGEARVAELSRMLAGLPASKRAQGHARELLELAAQGT